MLFKTQSATVYGIDAYLVQVEVDVGSARMQHFNVVGLPDNAVKESRERIKSALRNCGYEFSLWSGRDHQSGTCGRAQRRLRI
jgi:magnesium chelatase family protein